VQGLQVQLSWTDNANNENAFKIERSTDGINFTPLNIASVNATSYTDTAVTSGTTYTYRLRATNPLGESNYTNTSTATPIFAPPIALYHFDDSNGTIAADSTGINTGVLVGANKPVWVAGRVGTGALSFSGNGAYNQTQQSAVQVSSNLVPTLGTTSTLTAWVKTTQTGSNTHSQAPAITGVDQAGTSSDINWGTLNATGRIGIFVGDTGGIYSTNPINDGQWHNVAMTRDATTGIVQLYVDGVFNASGTFDVGTKAAQFYLIGALTDRNSSGYVTGANYFNGQLDEVRIYNHAISAAEISDIGQLPSAPSGLSASAIPDTGSMLQLSWTNTSEFAPAVAVERKTGIAGTYQPIATLDGAETSYIDTNLDPGTEYSYRVQSIDSAGASEYSSEASAVPPHTEILGRFIFYNNSQWDNEKATSNVTDGLALATDKQALLPGQTATFQNYTSYSQGITGIMIDVTNFDGTITPDDYELRVGNSSDTSTWQAAPTPALVTEYPGFGVNGSIRLELTWDSNAIQNEWVQVTLKANDNTNLAADDVFYFGNAIGDTGNSSTDAIVDAADTLAAQNNHTAAASITNRYDFNRDKVVDATDDVIVQNNLSGESPLLLITVPGPLGLGASLESKALTPASGSAASLGLESAPIETPVVQSSITSVPLKLSEAPFATTLIPDRLRSVDAVFDDPERVPTRGDFSASLLNLESTPPARMQKLSDETDAVHWRLTEESYNDASCVADELIASEFGHLKDGGLNSLL
jgi:fibronectin type 3 domain-containing protein